MQHGKPRRRPRPTPANNLIQRQDMRELLAALSSKMPACAFCEREFLVCERMLKIRYELPCDPFPPMIRWLFMHGDCANEFTEVRDRGYFVAERMPTGYPLRYETFYKPRYKATRP